MNWDGLAVEVIVGQYIVVPYTCMRIELERFSYDLEKWFRYSVRYLFHQPISKKIKTRTLRFPAIENPNMVKALFDWPIVLQYDVKAEYRLISRKFLGMTFFHPSVRLFDKPIKSLYFRSFVFFCFVYAFSFQGHAKIALIRTRLHRNLVLANADN